MSNNKVINEILDFCDNPKNSKNLVCKSLAVTNATQKPPLSSILNIIVKYTSGLDLTDEERDLAFTEFAKITRFHPPHIENIYLEVEKVFLFFVNVSCMFIYVPIYIFFLLFIVTGIGKIAWYVLLIVFVLFTAVLALFWLTYYYGISYLLKSNFSSFVVESEKYVKTLERSFVDILPGINKMSEKIEELVNN